MFAYAATCELSCWPTMHGPPVCGLTLHAILERLTVYDDRGGKTHHNYKQCSKWAKRPMPVACVLSVRLSVRLASSIMYSQSWCKVCAQARHHLIQCLTRPTIYMEETTQILDLRLALWFFLLEPPFQPSRQVAKPFCHAPTTPITWNLVCPTQPGT